MKSLIILFSSLILAACVSTPSENELGYEGKKSTGSNAIQIMEELKQRPEVTFSKNNGWDIANIDTEEEKALWSFVPSSHPSYPSVVKREVVQRDGGIYIDTNVVCGASKTVCDQLVKDFIELNNKTVNEISK